MDHDGRTTNRMDAESKLIHLRLEIWAKWSRENALPGTWARSSTINKMMTYGLVGASQPVAPVEVPEAIEETERALGRLPAAELAAIRRYYLHWETVEVSARHLKITRGQLRHLLQRARWVLKIVLDLQARKVAQLGRR